MTNSMLNIVRPGLVGLLLGSALLAGCGTQVVNPVTGQTERSVMDEKTELAEGRKAHEQVLKEYSVYPDPKVQAYVNALGQKLAAQSHRASIPWTFTVLDSPEVNAFALPGGYVYVTRGIMAYMESEADLAGVIGHEIGHVTARHGAQRATRQQDAGIGVLAAALLGVVIESQTGLSGSADLLGQAAQGVAAGYVAKYSRDQELQADALGAEYLARSHYDPGNMVDVIGVLKSQERFAVDQALALGKPAPDTGGWLASHPSNDQRLQAIREQAKRYAGQYGDDRRDPYLQLIDGLRFGESPEQGMTRGQNFYHPPMDIALTAARAWRIENSTEALTVISPRQDAAIRLLVVPPKAGATHDDIIRNVFNPVRGAVTRGQLSGMPSTRFTGVARNKQGGTTDVEFTLVSGPHNTTYLLLYLATDASALQRHSADLRAIEQSFRPMTDDDRRAALPWELDLVSMPGAGFAGLQRTSPVPEGQLRLLNGVYGGADPAPGAKVKTVIAR